LRWMIEAGQGTDQTILYGVPSNDLTSPPRHIAIERVTADTGTAVTLRRTRSW